MLTAATVAAGLSASCGAPNCTAELRNALVVTVRDATGSDICTAIVTAIDGNFRARLQSTGSSPPCTYVGPPERKGTYAVIARVDGQSASTSGIRVTGDQCHVQSRDVTLTPR
jgi:hypothetical protein